jgi:hypothetical protein
MTKGEMRSSVQGALRRIDKTAKFHDALIDKAIESSVNQFLYDIYRNSPHDLDVYTKEYGTEVALAVTENESTEEFYTNIPVPYVSLPEKNSGIRYVVGHDRDHRMIYPMSNREMLLARTSYVGSSTAEDGDPFTRSFYAVQGQKLIYFQVNSDLVDAGVRVGIVVPFSVYADSEEVNIPFGQDDKVFMSVMQKLMQLPPVDQRDNNKD